MPIAERTWPPILVGRSSSHFTRTARLFALELGSQLLRGALFSVVTHLTFREVMDTDGYPRLLEFCRAFGERPAALATTYRFDTAP